MPWFVLHLHPRCEKKVAEVCRVNGLPFYLPLRTVTRTYPKRKATFGIPLFPGYLFAGLDAAGRLAVLRSNHVAHVLTPHSSYGLLRQLAQVRRALIADPGLETARALTRGQRVRIVAGPFAGIEGLVDRLKGAPARVRVVLNVDIVGQSVAVEADGTQVRPL